MLSSPPTRVFNLADTHGAALADFWFYPDYELLYVRWHGQLTGAEVIRAVQLGAQWGAQWAVSLVFPSF